MKNRLSKMQKTLLIATIVPMIAIGGLGGIGTYSNLSAKYGSETALGALGAGEGATAILALVLLVTTLFSRPAPRIVRAGLWALPGAAAVMGATAAEGLGQTIVYALTPMAITAAAESLAYLARIVVIHQDGRDVEAETRAAAVIRDLAYHQARAAAHPSERARKASVRKSWRLARMVGEGDTALGADLLDVQRNRLSASADVALERMFSPGLTAARAALPTASATEALPLLPTSTGDATTPRAHESTIREDANGYPAVTGSDQQEETENVRPSLALVRTEKTKKPSIAADVRRMAEDGVKDVQHVLAAIATRHGRDADDKTFQQTVTRYWREAKAAPAAEAETDTKVSGPYL